MKIDLNTEKNTSVQAASADTAVTVSDKNINKAEVNTTGGLTRDMWDKRNLMNSLERAWDSEDTAVISDNAKQGIGIVGDPRIVGEKESE